jgi:hypothetical protein
MAEVLRRHGLPVLPEEIGFTTDEFVEAVEYAPRTRPGRYTILEHLDLHERPDQGHGTRTMSRPSVAELRPSSTPPG